LLLVAVALQILAHQEQTHQHGVAVVVQAVFFPPQQP
jgi:hypothetical protein